MTLIDFGHWENLAGHVSNDTIGFIYIITNLTNNKKYIGKKLLFFKTSKKPLKGKVNRRRGTKDSDWQTYTGSSKLLNEDINHLGKDKFKFQILKWCNCKADLTYQEMKHIIDANALYSIDYYNEYLGGRLRIKK